MECIGSTAMLYMAWMWVGGMHWKYRNVVYGMDAGGWDALELKALQYDVWCRCGWIE